MTLTVFLGEKKKLFTRKYEARKKKEKTLVLVTHTHTHNLGNEQILELDKQMITLARI